ncbi:MAG: ABC transporter substrate-binding protein [Formivibrio sp.]|nr:ABC transporter substrate-binding protein [Formivibrio sp.]
MLNHRLNLRRWWACAAAVIALGAAPAHATTITVATISEPPSLDPATTSDLVSMITQHMFETLYTYNSEWKVAPLLAAGFPEISKDGLHYVITLRPGLKFHTGAAVTPADVAASLERWLKASPRGKLASESVTSIKGQGNNKVEITLKEAFPPLLALLAYPNGAAAVMPKAIAEASTNAPLKEYVGTGPFRFLERKPDQYIRLVKFDQYSSPTGTPNGFAGSRVAKVDELRFVPVPNANTRLEGVLAGQFDYADSLNSEFYDKIKASTTVKPAVIKPASWAFLIFNTKQGVMADPNLRLAAQAAIQPESMMIGGFGNPDLINLESSLFPKQSMFHSTADAALYNQKDGTAKAKQMLAKAGYKGQPIRILTSPQYDFLYKMSQVAAQNLQEAGFKVDLQVVDWATLLQKRGDPAVWDGFFTFHGFVPEPALVSIVNPSYPGWWDSPAKRAAFDKFSGEQTDAARVKAWAEMQKLFMEEAPTLKIGEFSNLGASSRKLTGFTPMIFPAFWNVAR